MRTFFKLLVGLVLIFLVIHPAFSQLSENVIRQIESLNQEKEARTPVQKKIDCQLLYAIKQDRGEAITALVRTLEVNVNKEAGGLVPVDIKVSSVTKALLQTIENAGGKIIFGSSFYKTINATIPLQAVEEIAASADVLFIYPADSAFTHGPEKNFKNKNFFKVPFKLVQGNDKKGVSNFKSRADEIRDQLNGYIQNKEEFDRDFFFIGSTTSEGDVTHRAAEARAAFGVTGAGVKIGVISDGVTNLASSQSSGDLGTVTVLSGQAGNGDEGTAMLEIIHDLAPGAQLFFATAVNSQASFAQNILNLRAAGCDIIVDDIIYHREAVFQDDNVARAVNTVTADGALYFSSAGNEGNKDDNTSGVWEGDFNDAGTGIVGAVTIAGGTVHNFSGGITNNLLTVSNSGKNIGLFWSDPLGGSGNDYDLYVLNNALTSVVSAATNVQDGNDDPVELSTISPVAGNRLVIFKKTGAAIRALHLNTFRGRLNFNTQGQTHGHSAAAAAYCVAATPAATPFGGSPNPAGPYPNPHNSSNMSETFTSDGPRRMFYNSNGTAVTSGNVLFGTNGGTVRQKPDITAADGVSVTGAGGFYVPFFGTSAAAPHAAAIAALIKSALPSITPAQIRTALTSSAIDIETPGVDRNTGAGIVMAYQSLVAAGVASAPIINTLNVTQPTCTTPTGTIVVNATGSGTLEYSIDNGANWQLSNTFSGLAPGNYNIKVRQQTNPANSATYSGNPVVINAAPADNQPPTIVLKANPTIFLTAANTYTVQLSDVLQSVSDNCDPNPSATVSTLSVSCANIGSGGSGTPHQPFVATNATGNQDYTGEQGTDFRVNATNGIVITQLGAFDHQSNGLMGTQPDGNGGFGIRVAIFNKATHAIVPGLDAVISGNGDAFANNYRYKNIAAVTLPTGNYVVIAKGYNPNELNGNSYLGGGPYPQGDDAGGAISYLNSVYYADDAAGFTYPTNAQNTGTATVLKGATFTYALNQSNMITITATDVSGNQSQMSTSVIVVDTFYTLTTKDITVALNSSGQASIQPADVLQSLKNNCGIDVTSSTLQVSPFSFNCSNVNTVAPHQPFVANNATGNQDYTGEQGTDFRVNATNGIVVTQLGAFDHQGNGIMGTQPDGNGGFGIRVGIFNKATRAIVPGLDAVITGSGDAFANNYRYKNIAAVTLPPGDYIVMAKGYNPNELNGNSYLGGGPYPAGDNAGGAISYLNSVFYADDATGFTYPANSQNTGAATVLKGATLTYALNQSNVVTLTATDVYGHQRQATANVSVVDNTGPVITTKNITLALDATGHASIQPGDVLQSPIMDNCNVNTASITVSPNSFTCADYSSGNGIGAPHQPFVANSPTGNQDYTGEQGTDFRVNATNGIVITQLGAFDHQANGLMGTQPDGNGNLGIRVAIFSKATHAIVPGLDAVITGTGDVSAGNYRYKNIPAVTLAAGDYIVIAKGYNANELNGNSYLDGGLYPQGDDAGGAISYPDSVFYDTDAAGFTYPANAQYTGAPTVLKGATFTYALPQNNNKTVTVSATDTKGNVSQQTAVVTLTDPMGACTAQPVMAYAAKSGHTDVPVVVDNVSMTIKVYPNPTTGQFTVQLYHLKVPKVSMQIMDADGQVVVQKEATLSGKTPTLFIPVDISKHAAGIYLVKVISADGVQTTKVVMGK